MSQSLKNYYNRHPFLSSLIILCFVGLLTASYLFVIRPRIYRWRYRLKYEDSILSYSAEFNVDPSLTAAVIFCESGYSASAVSRAGAYGLMQLMPATAKEAAEAIGIDGFAEKMLGDADTNIRIGCYYLSLMLKSFHNVKNALSAYNAGPGRTREWISKYGTDDTGSLLYIPYPETEKYVSRVMSAQRVYRKLYPQLIQNR